MNRRELLSGLGLIAASNSLPALADDRPTDIVDSKGGTRGIIFSTPNREIISNPQYVEAVQQFHAGIKEFLRKCGMDHVQTTLVAGVDVHIVESGIPS